MKDTTPEMLAAVNEWMAARDALREAHARAYNSVRPYINNLIASSTDDDMLLFRLSQIAANPIHGEPPYMGYIYEELRREANVRMAEILQYRSFSKRRATTTEEGI